MGTTTTAPNPAGGTTRSGTAAEFVPANADLTELHDAATGCTGCDIYRHATQVVIGRGPVPAQLMLVGEQPGDREDVEGEPFVGPAGSVLASALALAGIDRDATFVTNVVKHFKWRPTPGGKRRLHERPNPAEVRACRPWLEAELELVTPEIVVLLGATAAQSVLGPAFRVTADHGRLLDSPLPAAGRVMATLHPSAILRSRTDADRERQMQILVEDLGRARAALRH